MRTPDRGIVQTPAIVGILCLSFAACGRRSSQPGDDRVGAAAFAAIRVISLADLCESQCQTIQIDSVVRAVPDGFGPSFEQQPDAGRLPIIQLAMVAPIGVNVAAAKYPGAAGSWFLSAFMVTRGSDSTKAAVGLLVRRPNSTRRVWSIVLRWDASGWTGSRAEASYYP